jgi:hypothetical protein
MCDKKNGLREEPEGRYREVVTGTLHVRNADHIGNDAGAPILSENGLRRYCATRSPLATGPQGNFVLGM